MKTVHGDLIRMACEGAFDVVVQGCNCMCVMGKGLAKQIREELPDAYEADLRTKKGDRGKLGSYSYALCKANPGIQKIIVVNAYTQFDYWRLSEPKALFVDYDAVRLCFRKIKNEWSGYRFGIPMIGAGLAGGDWSVISAIIEEEMAGEDLTLVKFGAV